MAARAAHTPRGLADLLRPFGIRPTTVRIVTATPKGYRSEDFAEAFASYLSDSNPQHPQHASDSSTLPLKNDPQQTLVVADTKSGLSPRDPNDVADVADRSLFDGPDDDVPASAKPTDDEVEV